MQTQTFILPTGEALRKYRPMLNDLEANHGIRRIDVVQEIMDPILEYLSNSQRLQVFASPVTGQTNYDLFHQIYGQRIPGIRLPAHYRDLFANLFMDILVGSFPFIGEIVKNLPQNLEQAVRFMIVEILYEDVVIEVFYH